MQFKEIEVKNELDSFDGLKFMQFDKLQQDITNEFAVPTDLVNELNKGKKLDTKIDYRITYGEYFERANKYLENIVNNIKDLQKQKSAKESLNSLKETFNRITQYLDKEFYKYPNIKGKSRLQDKCQIENLSSFYSDIESGNMKSNTISSMMLTMGLSQYSTSLNSTILSYNNEDIYDVLMSIYNDAGIGYDKLDDPEAKFLCHISQSLKNSVQKCETVSTQLELLKLNKELSESKNELDKLKKGSRNLAVDCQIIETDIDKIDEKVDNKIKEIESLRDKYIEKSNIVINNKINEKKQELEAKYKQELEQKKKESHIERDGIDLNKIKTRISNYDTNIENTKKEVYGVKIRHDDLSDKLNLMLEENKDFEGILDKEINQNEQIYNNRIREDKKIIEKTKKSFNNEGLNLDDYLKESPEDLKEKIRIGGTNLNLVSILEEDKGRNKLVLENAELVKKINLKSSKVDKEKFYGLITNYFGNATKEERQELKNNYNTFSSTSIFTKDKDKEAALNYLKKAFNSKNEMLSRTFAEDYNNAKNVLKDYIEKYKNPDDIRNEIKKEIFENTKKLSTVEKIPNELRDAIKDLKESTKALEYVKTRKEFLEVDKKLNDLKNVLNHDIVEKMKDELERDKVANVIDHNTKQLKNYDTNAKKLLEKDKNNVIKDEDIQEYYNKQSEQIEKYNQEITKAQNYKTNIKNSLDELTQNTKETINNHNSIMDSAKETFNESYDKFLRIIDKNLKNFEIRSVTPDAGSHKNTKSYTDMMEAIANARMTLAMGADGSTDEKIQALDNIKNMCNEYIKAKKSQFAPFPSQMRKARLQFAEDLKKYAENASKNLKDTFKETEVAEKFKQYTKLNFTKNVVDFVNAPKIDASKFNKESITQSIINLQKDKNIKSAAESIVKSRKEEIENNKMTDLSLKSKHELELEKNLKSDSDELEIKLGF